MKINASTHPRLIHALNVIEMDQGMEYDHNMEVEVTDGWVEDLDLIEKQIATLNDEELEIFCAGEAEEMDNLVREKGLEKASQFVEGWFNGEL